MKKEDKHLTVRNQLRLITAKLHFRVLISLLYCCLSIDIVFVSRSALELLAAFSPTWWN